MPANQLVPVIDDKHVNWTVTITKAHPTPFVTFRGAKMVPTSGQTRFKAGDRTRIMLPPVGQQDGWLVVAHGDAPGAPEQWDWEGAVAFREMMKDPAKAAKWQAEMDKKVADNRSRNSKR